MVITGGCTDTTENVVLIIRSADEEGASGENTLLDTVNVSIHISIIISHCEKIFEPEREKLPTIKMILTPSRWSTDRSNHP